MGIWDFVKSAGKALGIGKEDTPPSAEELKKELDSYKLGTEKVKVEVQGDKAIVTGDVADQSVLEKAIIAVGNTLGISKVESNLTAPAQKDPVFYTVKKGDNPWKIAEKHYANQQKTPAARAGVFILGQGRRVSWRVASCQRARAPSCAGLLPPPRCFPPSCRPGTARRRPASHEPRRRAGR